MIIELISAIVLVILTICGLVSFIIYVISSDRYFFDLAIGFYLLALILVLVGK